LSEADIDASRFLPIARFDTTNVGALTVAGNDCSADGVAKPAGVSIRIVVDPFAIGWNALVALVLPPLIRTGVSVIVPTAGLEVDTVIEGCMPPRTACGVPRVPLVVSCAELIVSGTLCDVFVTLRLPALRKNPPRVSVIVA